MAVLAPRTGTRSAAQQPLSRSGAWRTVPREILVVALGVVIYFSVRGLTASDAATAVENARTLVDLERSLGIAWEGSLQQLVIDSQWAVTLLNWIYIWGHWPVIATVLLWLALRHPAVYYRTRNAMIASGLIGIAIFVNYPVAPPRLAGMGLVDTVTAQSESYRVLQPPAFVNQYAALPSLHVGWDLLMGIAVMTASSRLLLRAVGVLMPLAMVAAVVLTANHYLVDVVAGVAVALTGLAVARVLERRRQPAAAEPRVIVLPAPRTGSPAGTSGQTLAESGSTFADNPADADTSGRTDVAIPAPRSPRPCIRG
jgi:membrane-associated phospholipid phosphatase